MGFNNTAAGKYHQQRYISVASVDCRYGQDSRLDIISNLADYIYRPFVNHTAAECFAPSINSNSLQKQTSMNDTCTDILREFCLLPVKFIAIDRYLPITRKGITIHPVNIIL